MKRVILIGGLLVIAGLLSVPGVSLWYESGDGENCTRCHEMRPAFESWRASAHHKVKCQECHGDALTPDAQFHLNNVSRVRQHLLGELPEFTRIRESETTSMSQDCARCHRSQHAAWSAGPHAATYQKIFLDPKHNRDRMLMDDCFRCHGMFYEGSIGQLVTPVNHEGPWRLNDPARAAMPAIPCLACHAVHQRGIRHSKTQASPALAFFDRRSRQGVPAKHLPIPAMQKDGRAVKMSPDPRQGLCYQCHAALPAREVGSGDDRTPTGVHEGLSCQGCHDPHRQSTRASCATCHPRLSNCGLDVEKMDTTFLNKESKHNVHWVACIDCHPKGAPRQRLTSPSTPARASLRSPSSRVRPASAP